MLQHLSIFKTIYFLSTIFDIDLSSRNVDFYIPESKEVFLIYLTKRIRDLEWTFAKVAIHFESNNSDLSSQVFRPNHGKGNK